MNENKVIVWVYTLMTAVIATLATVFNMIIEKYYVESGTGLYKMGVVTPEAFVVFLMLGVIVIIASAFLFRKDGMPKEVYKLPFLTSILSVIAAIALIYFAVGILMEDLLPSAASSLVYKIKYIGAYVSFPAGLYYFISVFSGSKDSKTESAFSFFPLIWTWAGLLSMYFDHTVEMSSPARVVKEIGLIMLMLAQLVETRGLIGRSKPVIYLIISSVAVVFLSPAYIPAVVRLINGEATFDQSAAYDIYCAVMALYLFTKIVGYAIKCSEGPKKEKKYKHGKNDIFTEEEDVENLEEVSEEIQSVEIVEEDTSEETEQEFNADEVEESEVSDDLEAVEENDESEEAEESEEKVKIDDIFKENENK